MTRRPLPTMRTHAALPSLSVAAPVMRIPTEQERGHAERRALYTSGRWKRERRAYLRANPHCTLCGEPARVVDHRDGHQRADWLARFWDPSTWQPLCRTCHNRKCGQELAAWSRGGMGVIESKVNGSGYRRGPSGECRQLHNIFPEARNE